MNKKMKGLTLFDIRNLKLEEYNVPQPQENQIRIKVRQAGICASDINYWENGSHRLSYPVILGHEIAGTVDKVGEKATKFPEGKRVISKTTFKVCGVCKYCKMGSYNLCIEREGVGSRANGGFADYIVVPQDSILEVPNNISLEEAALVEPLACAVHAVMEQTTIKKRNVTLVIGPGPIGLLAAQVARHQGSTVVLCGLNNDINRLKIAKEKLNIDLIVNIEEEVLNEKLASLTNGYGPNNVIECSGSYEAINMGLKEISKKGTFVQLGIPSRSGKINYPSVLFKEIEIVGSASHIDSSWETAIKLIEQRAINVKDVISHKYSIENWEKGFSKTKNQEGLKILLEP